MTTIESVVPVALAFGMGVTAFMVWQWYEGMVHYKDGVVYLNINSVGEGFPELFLLAGILVLQFIAFVVVAKRG